MQLGVFSRTYPPGIDGLFSRAMQDGFRAVQFNLSSVGLPSLPPEWPGFVLEDVSASAARHGIALCALSGTYNMAHPDADERGAARVGFTHVVRAAQVLRTPLVTLCTGTRETSDLWKAHPENSSAEAWSALRAELDFALELAERHDIVLGIEPEPGNVIVDARAARRLLDEVGSPRLKIVLDAANLLPPDKQARQREVVAEAVALLGADLALVHTKDVGPNGEAVAAGRGVVDFGVFLRAVQSTGYRGALVSHNFPVEHAGEVARFLAGVLAEIE